MDPVAGREGVDGGGVDVRVRVEVEVSDPFVPREPGGLDPADGGASVAVVAFREQQFGEEALVGELLLLRRGDRLVHDRPDCGQAQPAAGLVDCGCGGFLGHSTPSSQGGGDRC